MRLTFPRLKLFKHWWGIPLAVFVLVFSTQAFLAYVLPARAGTFSEIIWSILSYIFQAIASFEGTILVWLISLLITVSGYNNFINARAVSVGWPLVRDVANMFYILIMLVIAFATMLKIENYSVKKLLPRLIVTVILVNFSKTIIGLLIDFGQVIMLTFVNGYAATAGGNFIQMFQVQESFKLNQKVIASDDTSVSFDGMISNLLAMITLGISMIVVLVFVLVLLFRIVSLWILIILSPLAFLLGTFPKGQEHYSKWWKELINNIIVGPIVAFFLWLSLAVMGSGGGVGMSDLQQGNVTANMTNGNSAEVESSVGATMIGTVENLGSFAVAIAMLLMGLSQIKDLGVAGAGLATGATAWMKKTATTALKKVAIPAAATIATGGVGGAILAMGAAKGTMDVMARMPLIGKTVQKARKGMEAYGLGESGKAVNLVHKKVGMPAIRGLGKAAGAAVGIGVGTAAGMGTALVGGAGMLIGKGLRKAGPAGGRLETAGSALETKSRDLASKSDQVENAVFGKVGGTVGGVITGATRRMEAGIAATERGEARKGSANVRELTGDQAISEAMRPPMPFNDTDAQWVYANQARVLKDPRLVEQLEKNNPGGTAKLLASFGETGKRTGNAEESLKIIGDFKKGNVRFNTDADMAKAVSSIHPDNIKNVSNQDLADPRVAKYFNADQVAKMSNSQEAAYRKTGATPLPGKQQATQKRQQEEQEEALRNHLGLTEAQMSNDTDVQFAVQRVGGLVPQNGAAPPIPISAARFDQLRPDQQFDALEAGNITVGQINATAFTSTGGKLAGAVAQSSNDDLIKEAGAISEFRTALQGIVASGTGGKNYQKMAKKALAVVTPDAQQAQQAIGYNPPVNPNNPNDLGNFQAGGQQAVQEAFRASGDQPPPWTKNLRFDDLIKSLGNNQYAFTQLTQEMSRNRTVQQTLSLIQKNNTEAEKHFISTLLAHKLKSPATSARERTVITQELNVTANLDIAKKVDDIVNKVP